MSSYATSSAASSHRAITDVYDEERRTFLVRYPVPLVVGLALAGVIAFAVTGFLGLRPAANQPFQPLQPWDTLFKEPWPLFLWFCGLIMALEISILRDRRLRGEMTAALIVTVLSMILVGIIYFYGLPILDLLRKILNITTVLPEIGDSPYTYALINFGILAIFWTDTLGRWGRVAMGKPLRRGVDIGFEQEDRPAHDADHPGLDEVISGDLIAGAALALVLALVFRAGVINFLSQLLQTKLTVNTCTVSWPVGHCAAGGTQSDPPTLFFMDLLQSLVYLPLGLLILALSATIAGLGAGEGLDARANETRGRLRTPTQPGTAESPTTSAEISAQVAQTIFDTLRTALNRRVRSVPGNLALSLRNAVWPMLVFVSTLSVAAGAREIQLYLHVLSDEQTCTVPGYLSCSYVNSNLAVNGQPYTSLAIALVLGAIAVLAITFAMAFLIFRQRVAENTLRFLGLIGEIVLLTFWIFSLTLSVFNLLLWLLDRNVRVPFPQPGAATALSLAAFLIWGIYLIATRGRNRGGGQTQTTRAPAQGTASESTIYR
jgi:hypothetical protein